MRPILTEKRSRCTVVRSRVTGSRHAEEKMPRKKVFYLETAILYNSYQRQKNKTGCMYRNSFRDILYWRRSSVCTGAGEY